MINTTLVITNTIAAVLILIILDSGLWASLAAGEGLKIHNAMVYYSI